MHVAGVDGTKGGWVAIVLDDAGRFVSDHVLRPVECSFEELRECEVIAVDVPIGFGPRAADAAARGYLRGNAGTVFSTPRRDVLDRPFGPGLGVSAQAHALGRRILHVTRLAHADDRIEEVHPEVSFRAMNEGRPLRHRKKSAGGALERAALLERHGIGLDRLAAAWSARRIATGAARPLPDPPELLEGRPTAIWY